MSCCSGRQERRASYHEAGNAFILGHGLGVAIRRASVLRCVFRASKCNEGKANQEAAYRTRKERAMTRKHCSRHHWFRSGGDKRTRCSKSGRTSTPYSPETLLFFFKRIRNTDVGRRAGDVPGSSQRNEQLSSEAVCRGLDRREFFQRWPKLPLAVNQLSFPSKSVF